MKRYEEVEAVITRSMSATGIEAKGREVGMAPEQFASWPEFKAAVLRQLMRAA